MERYSSRTVDELNRLVLHSELRNKLGLNTGDKVSLKTLDTIVILRKLEGDSDCAVCQIDELGMIELPKELRQQLGWKAKDKIALYNTDNIIILKSA